MPPATNRNGPQLDCFSHHATSLDRSESGEIQAALTMHQDAYGKKDDLAGKVWRGANVRDGSFAYSISKQLPVPFSQSKHAYPSSHAVSPSAGSQNA